MSIKQLQDLKDSLLTTEQAADILNRSPATLATWRSRGKGPAFIKVGGSPRYRIEDLRAFLEGSN